MTGYTEDHAKSGLDAPLPEIECWRNQFPGYEIDDRHSGIHGGLSQNGTS